jgi:hypothetical protein
MNEFKIEKGNICQYKYYIIKIQYLYSSIHGAKFISRNSTIKYIILRNNLWVLSLI